MYETVVFGGRTHQRLTDLDAMRDRTLTISGASKLFNMTGWRVGWITGPADLIAGTRGVHGYTTFSAPTPLQEGVAAALEGAESAYFNGIAGQFEENHRRLGAALAKLGARVFDTDGGYFLICDVAETGMSGLEYCRWLVATKKVAAVPLSVFHAPAADGSERPCSLVRFAICKQAHTIDQAIAALEQP